MNAVQLAWNAIETYREVLVVCFLFGSPLPCADGGRGCFREARKRGCRGLVNTGGEIEAGGSGETFNDVR
jgi:pyruvate-formate lyase-activating enzyme